MKILFNSSLRVRLSHAAIQAQIKFETIESNWPDVAQPLGKDWIATPMARNDGNKILPGDLS